MTPVRGVFTFHECPCKHSTAHESGSREWQCQGWVEAARRLLQMGPHGWGGLGEEGRSPSYLVMEQTPFSMEGSGVTSSPPFWAGRRRGLAVMSHGPPLPLGVQTWVPSLLRWAMLSASSQHPGRRNPVARAVYASAHVCPEPQGQGCTSPSFTASLWLYLRGVGGGEVSNLNSSDGGCCRKPVHPPTCLQCWTPLGYVITVPSCSPPQDGL